MQPQFKHDCDVCKFIGCAKYHDKECDFYLCVPGSNGRRTVLARYSDVPSEYASGALFECVELTHLDKFVLLRGLELNEDEHKKLLELLLESNKRHWGINDYRLMPDDVDEQHLFGNENWFRQD